MFGCMLVLMKDRFEAKIPKPLDFVDISEVWEGPQRGTGRRCGGVALAERKWKPGATHTHTHTSREAAGMIPGESLRSFLGEGASETERESPRWLPSSCSSASLIIKGVCFNPVVTATFKDPYSGAPAATKHSGKLAHKGTSGLFFSN